VKRMFLPLVVAVLVGAASASVIFAASRGSSVRNDTSASPIGAAATPSTSGTRHVVSSTAALTATQIYQHDSAGVVSIKAVTSEGEDTGTGIVLDGEGLILTNNHVIAEAANITVSPGKSSSVSRTATLVGQDANSDLALIKVDPSGLGLTPLKLVSSSPVQVGDPVYAIGNPYGLDETLTKGIVSALDREIAAPDGAKIGGAIQTDAALNPGNSGGPLLNDQGEVIGVNSQIASDAASVEGSQPGSTGVGFAISSNTVAEVVKAIKAGQGTSSQNQVEGGSTQQSPNGESSPYGSETPYGSRSPYGSGEASEESPSQDESSPGAEGLGGAGSGTVSGGEGQTVVIVP
jgi:putative serine protease PepD